MKKLLFLLSCLLMLTVAYSQEKDTVLSPTKVQLMKKSRVQKTFGWFMAGTGVPVVLSCMYFLTFPDDAIEKGKVVAALTGGIIYTVGGISLIRKGKRNKEKALSLGLGPGLLSMPMLTGYQVAPSVVLSFRL